MKLYFSQAVYLASEGLRPAGAVKAVAVGQVHEGSAVRAGAPWPSAPCGVVPTPPSNIMLSLRPRRSGARRRR
ncbi:MAG: hypothetical protein ACO2PN_02210 [Pyrobaculum sp.]